jgi:hypothetical protein
VSYSRFFWVSGGVVEALRHKPEGGGFDSWWRSLEFYIEFFVSAVLWSWGRLSHLQKRVPRA